MKSSSKLRSQDFKDLFALDHSSIERDVTDVAGNYKDLPLEALYTSTEDLFEIIKSSFVLGTWADLGAGVGESALMYGMIYPDRKAVAVERDGSRVSAGKEVLARLGLSNVQILQGDLLTMAIPQADTYFLYFPTGPVLDRILSELAALPMSRLIAVESHGDLLPRLDKENWLLQEGEIQLKGQRHYPRARVYRKLPVHKAWGPHSISFLDQYLEIEDDRGRWIGDSFGLEWLQGEQYQLLRPPRTISWNQVKAIHTDLPEKVLGWVKKRKQKSKIRKIYVHPRLAIELADGSLELVE